MADDDTKPRRGRIPADVDAEIRRMINDGCSDQMIASTCHVSQITVAMRRARLTAPPDIATATPQVIGALRHLAASDGLTITEVAERLRLAESEATAIVHALITLGVVRRTVGEPVRYGLRKDWL